MHAASGTADARGMRALIALVAVPVILALARRAVRREAFWRPPDRPGSPGGASTPPGVAAYGRRVLYGRDAERARIGGLLEATVDDAQWLDDPPADALVSVARRLDAEAIVILFQRPRGRRATLRRPRPVRSEAARARSGGGDGAGRASPVMRAGSLGIGIDALDAAKSSKRRRSAALDGEAAVSPA